MRPAVRILASVLIAAGVLGLAWVVVVWRWEDPFTALYTNWQQDKLANQLTREFAAYKPARHPHAGDRAVVAGEAARFRGDTRPGEAIGRIVIGRIGLNMVLVDGTDEESLKTGPGRDLRSFMPGQDRLVYIAGHRTTYLAPFSHIDSIRVGDAIRLEMPYASFVYRMTADRIVRADDLTVLNSPDHELLILQACHPRFFATHRYLVYASLVSVKPRSPPTGHE
jgi:sortase A